MDEAADKTTLAVFLAAFDLIQRESKELGVDVPDAFRQKMLKWGIKYDIFPEAKTTEALIQSRNMLD